MNEILQKLRRQLTREDIDFRVGQIFQTSKGIGATILAYKDARTDMKVLDEATDGLWQNEYRRDSKGILQCGIGIKFGEEWVWKWSNGTPSNMDAEKGEYSDAFKRAGFMWGIGRELYDVPKLFVTLREGEYRMENGRPKATGKLRPNDWNWVIGVDLKSFVATDSAGTRLSIDESDVPEAPQTAPVAPQSSVAPKQVQSTDHGVCKDCGASMVAGKNGKPYCKPCYIKWAEEKKAAESIPTIEVQEDIPLADIPF